MNHMCKVTVWLDGVFVYNPKLCYVRGRKEEVGKICLDYLNMQLLYDIYQICGGKKLNVNFYFLYPEQTIEHGLKYIKDDASIAWLLNAHSGLDSLILYTDDDGLEPLITVDNEGNVIQPEIHYLEHGDEEIINEVSNEDPFPEVPPTKDPCPEVPTTEECFPEPSAEETFVEVPTTQAPVYEESTTNEDHFEEPTTKPSDDEICSDSDDGDYIQPEYYSDDVDVVSDAPTEELEDIEGSSDDDIFVDRHFSKAELVMKLKKMGKKSKRPSKRVQKCEVLPSTSEWFSEPEDDDTIENLDDSSKAKCPIFTEGESMKNRNLEVLMKFADVYAFREAVTDWLVRNGYELEFVKNDRKRVTAKCSVETCPWRIHASVVQGGPTFQIKTITGEHSCSKKRRNKHASAKYIGKRMGEIIKDNPDVVIHKLGNSVMRKVGIEAGYWKNLRAKRDALNKIRGQDAQEYSQLWDYCETVRSRNPGAKLLLRKVADSDPPVFERMYFSLPPMRMGFLAGCRPLIGLDGCFLKTPHGGQLLCAVGRDGNDNLLPIALAVVPIENRESWTWFLGELLEEIGGVQERKWTFISDRQKGLLETIKDLAPGCAHRFCVRHIYQNFKQKWSSLELKTLLWRAASTGNKNEFEAHMREIARLNQDAVEYLRNIPTCHWARSSFSESCKSDVLVNNLCESFNNYILDAREKPIISMFEWIRSRLTSRIQTKKAGMEKYEGPICPNILKKINKSQQLARNCFPRWHGREEFEVEIGCDRYVVDLAKKTCTCGLFQLNGYPCHHAWSCISDRRYMIEDYVDSCYMKDTYLKVYAYMIHAVPGPKDYIKTPYDPLAAPKYTKKAGRPKKMRRKGPDELHTTSYRKGLTHTCKNCLQQGHNKASCKNPTNQRSKFYKGNSATEGVENSQNAPPPSFSQPLSSASRTTPSNSSAPMSGPSSSVATRMDPSNFVAPSEFIVPPTTGRVYVGRRNEALLGRSKKFNKSQTTNQAQASVPPTVPSTVPSTVQACVHPTAQATVPPTVPNASNHVVRKRKPQISEILHNIKEASNKKRIWKV